MPLKHKTTTNKLQGAEIKGGSVGGWTDAQNNVARQLMMYYLAAGWTKAGASGMIGNQMQESALNPSEAGGYLSQWLGSRLANLTSFANQLGKPVTSVEAQAKFTVHEIRTGYKNLDKFLSSTNDPAAAALAISQQYERPAAWAANNAARQRYAQDVYGGITAASGSGGGGASSSDSSGGGSGAPGSILDLLTSPVSTLGGWLASIAVNLVKDTAEGIADVIIIPAFHWNQRAVMFYYSEMFGNSSWPMLPWTAVFWGFGYWLLFTDPSQGNLKPSPVRNSRLSRHARFAQGLPARNSLVKPKDVKEKTPKKPKPVISWAAINQVGTMQTYRQQTVKVTGTHADRGNATETRSNNARTLPAAPRNRKENRSDSPQSLAGPSHRTGADTSTNR